MFLSSFAPVLECTFNRLKLLIVFILEQLEQMDVPPDDKEELCSFIRSITKSPSDSKVKWEGPRCMVDILELIKSYYYDPLTNGSNSIKKVYPAILSRSNFLQEKYSQPIYGNKNEIPSYNLGFQQACVTMDDVVR